MSITCSICQDLLTERPQNLPRNVDSVMSSLPCGHLFHYVCVEQWFKTLAERAGNRRIYGEGECPCCKKNASLRSALRIFPTGDEDSNSVAQQRKNLEQAVTRNKNLVVEVSKLKEMLEQITGEFEDEIFQHDVLKVQYGETLSRLDHLQDQLNETKIMKTAMENSYKSQLEKVEKEKSDALKTILAMEAEEKRLKEEMKAFQNQNKENDRTRLNGQVATPKTVLAEK